MKYLKSYDGYRIPIYNQNSKHLAPKELEIITSNGHFKLELTDFCVSGNSHYLSIIYHQNTLEEVGSITIDAEPDYLCFDIWFTKNDEGLNITFDITYGDNMVCEFKITSRQEIILIHYTGLGSISDPETHFAFTTESLENLITFINRFSSKYNFSKQDFKFLDNDKGSFKYPNQGKSMPITGSIKLEPLSHGQKILVIDNTKYSDEIYKKSILQYLESRGIDYIVVSDDNDLKKIRNTKLVGIISTGSNYRILDDRESQEKIKINSSCIRHLDLPFLGICFGFQTLSKLYGSNLKSGDKEIFDKIKLDSWDKSSKLFVDIDLDKLQVSFDYHDIVESCPIGFKEIAKLGDRIVGVEKDSKLFGLLFHPEDKSDTHQILDNFVQICKGGQNHKDFVFTGRFENKKWR